MTTNANAVSSLIDAINSEKTRKAAIIAAAKAACGTAHLQPGKIAEQVESFLKAYETLERPKLENGKPVLDADGKPVLEKYSLKASKKVREDFRAACTLLLAGKFEVTLEKKLKGKEPAITKLSAVDAVEKTDREIEQACAQVRDAGRTPEQIKKQEAANKKRAATAAKKQAIADRQAAANAGKGEVSAANDAQATACAWLAKELAKKNHKALDQVLALAGYKLVKVEIPVRVHTMEG